MTITNEEFISYCKTKGPVNVILEIGAEDARDSLQYKEEFPKAKVYALEANPYIYGKNSPEGIHYSNTAIWDVEGEAVFYIKNAPHRGIDSFRDRGSKYGDKRIVLNTKTAAKFCKEQGIENIDILKIDVEGCSFEVLKSFGGMLNKVRLIHIETEQEQHFIGQHLEQEVFALLEDFNFKLVKHSNCVLQQYDSIWENNNATPQ